MQQKLQNIDFRIKNISQINFTSGKYDMITAFHLYLKNPEEIIKKIYECLPLGGYLITETDCMGEKFLLKQEPLSRLSILPPMNYFTMAALENIFINTGFKIVFCENVHNGTPNYYIVAKKQ